MSTITTGLTPVTLENQRDQLVLVKIWDPMKENSSWFSLNKDH
jgi:hypothetical protein